MAGEFQSFVVPQGDVRLANVVDEAAQPQQRPYRQTTDLAVEYTVDIEPVQIGVERLRAPSFCHCPIEGSDCLKLVFKHIELVPLRLSEPATGVQFWDRQCQAALAIEFANAGCSARLRQRFKNERKGLLWGAHSPQEYAAVPIHGVFDCGESAESMRAGGRYRTLVASARL